MKRLIIFAIPEVLKAARTVEVYSLDANRRTALGSFPPHVSRKKKVTEQNKWFPAVSPRAKVTDQASCICQFDGMWNVNHPCPPKHYLLADSAATRILNLVIYCLQSTIIERTVAVKQFCLWADLILR